MKHIGPVLLLVAAAGSAILIGCVQTKNEVDVKPVDINLNITGRLEVVITDARQTEEAITGSKPKRTVRPEDIGLPAAPAAKSDAGSAKFAERGDEGSVVLITDSSQTQLIQQMAARHQQVQALLDGKLAGESHTGSLVARASLSAAQQAVVDAENSDRAQLYAIEAARKNTTVDQVALGYYLARLEHVNQGTWVDHFDKATGNWEWFQWNQ